MKRSRIRENKKLTKVLKFNVFHSPYQVIIDGSFIKAVNKIENGIKMLQKTLNDFPKYIITKCEYEKYKSQIKDKDLSGKCEIFKCEHDSINESCIRNMFKGNNRNHYILASCDKKVISIRNEINNIPIIRIINY